MVNFERTQNRFGEDIYTDEAGRTYTVKDDGTVNFGDVAINLMGQQSQYGSRHIDGRLPGYPKLGANIPFTDGYGQPANTANYHSIGIPAEHIGTFLGRVVAYRLAEGETFPDGEVMPATEEEIAQGRAYLEELGIDPSA